MSSTDFKLSRHELIDFSRENKRAMIFLMKATNDYVVARCSLLNGLIGGLIPASQAVEKYLKATILFKNPKINVRKEFGHSLTDLKDKVAESISYLKEEETSNYLNKLNEHYHRKYPTGDKDVKPGSSFTSSTSEIHKIDEIVFQIHDQMPIPVEVQFRTGLYVNLFGKIQGELTHISFWLRKNNYSFKSREKKLNELNKLVEKHLELNS